MAKVVITVEDLPNGNVKIVSKPTQEQIMKIQVNTINGLTPAQAYSFHMLRMAREASKSGNPIDISIPRLKKGFH